LLALGASEILKAIGRKLGIPDGVLDVARLAAPWFVASVGQRVAAAMPEHVRVDEGMLARLPRRAKALPKLLGVIGPPRSERRPF